MKEPTDPMMPCLRVPCPCYDESDLAAFFPPYEECRYNRPLWGGVQDVLSDEFMSSFASIRVSTLPRFQRCIYWHGSTRTTVAYLSEAEASSCRATLTDFMDANQNNCMVINDYR